MPSHFAREIHADLLLMDDREGVIAARSKGLTVTGMLGALGLAAHHGLLNLAQAFDRLKLTNFHYRQDVMDQSLNEVTRKE
jgi:predicted nucleic acid-binding protein